MHYTALKPVTLLKNRLQPRCFTVSFSKSIRAPVLQDTTGRLALNIADTGESKCLSGILKTISVHAHPFIEDS